MTSTKSCWASCRWTSKNRYDMREVIARIVDDSDFLEFKRRSTAAPPSAATRPSRATPVGLIGNNGPIDPAGATKAAQFIQLCCQSGTPIVYLQNTTGYMVGKAAEQAGMIKHGSQDDPGGGQRHRAADHPACAAPASAPATTACAAALRPALRVLLAQRPQTR
jgi:hypothetical protein